MTAAGTARPGRLHVFGASGSGTTTFAAAWAARHGVAALDTDSFLWEPSDPPFERVRPAAERVAMLGAALDAAGTWVLSGSLPGWGDVFVPRFDAAVFLYTPPVERLRRLRLREVERYGADAIAPDGPLRDKHTAFLDWCASYDDGDLTMRSLRRHEAWIAWLPCPLVRVSGLLPTAAQIDQFARAWRSGAGAGAGAG